MNTPAPVQIHCECPARSADAEALSVRLGLPLGQDAALLLVFTEQRLELRQTGPGAPGPVYVDFVEGKAAHRRQFGGGRGQPLARAVGLKQGQTPEVLDATAGLGRDAFVLASLGCRVRLVERSPIVAALLEDGLRRALEDAEAGEIAARMSVTCTDSGTFLRELGEAERPTVVYLDPMYPERKKSAQVKKEMRLLQTLLGPDRDSEALLAAARGAAGKRVVVKRPAKAEPLGGLAPHATVTSPNTRYDIYLPQRPAD